ncbi:MAG TPA: carboxypeptidase-like regulatory domain-containing protein, partial [Terriglobia bacterium]|nr:carboxypeptidase-like regulatory domain-containing protein [Terriglobia bacterium]
MKLLLFFKRLSGGASARARTVNRTACAAASKLILLVLIAPLVGAGQQGSAPGVVEQNTPSSTGLVTAMVTGPGGVPVPGATVTLMESTTGERKQTWTNQAGNCTLTGIKPGVYRVEASLVGFQTEVRESVTVTAGETNRVSLVLRLATPVEASQEARAETTQAPPKPKASSEPGRTHTRDLPSDRATTAGEVGEESAASGGSVRFSEGAEGTASAVQQGNSGGDGESADSNASAQNSFLLSGGVGQAPTPGEPGRRTQEPKALRKALKRTPKLAGGGLSPGFGGGGGFGTAGAKYLQINRVRGNIVEEYSNSAYNARPYALNASPASQVAYHQERVAASIGGPLSIPGISSGKDKTSFFLHYQLQRGRNPFSSYSTVP